MTEYCPTCKRRLSAAQTRTCAKCGEPISRHHKYRLNEDGRLEHRHCDDPESYLPKEDPNG